MVPEEVTEEAVIAPVEREPVRMRPVTLPVLAAMAPSTVAVRETSPTTTDVAERPMRTTPVEPPVPASRSRSPPVDDASPAA